MAVIDADKSLVGASSTSLEDGAKIYDNDLGSVVAILWGGLANGDSGEPVSLAEFSDRSVQIGGTLGTGGIVLIEGSNDGVTYYTLHDIFGTALSATSLGLSGVAEITKWIRARVSAGDGTTDIDVTVIARR